MNDKTKLSSRLRAGVEAAPWVIAEVEKLEEALRDAIEAIERAEPNRHSPWCNGVHEGGCCEGEYLMSGFMARLRAALSVGETPEPSPSSTTTETKT